MFATGNTATMQSICDRFGISRKTGYKWLHRLQTGGWEALADQSRRPHKCPWKTSAAFDHWRIIYNTQRPHEALKMDVPSQHYRLSDRTFPERLPLMEYSPDDLVRKVQDKGNISFHGRWFVIGKAFYHYAVALRPTPTDGIFDVYFSQIKIAQINLHDNLES